MADTENQTLEAWGLSRLGFAIDSYVDREVNRSTRIADSGAYGIDDQGRIYTAGQPYGGAVVAQRQPISTPMLLLILAGVYLAMQK